MKNFRLSANLTCGILAALFVIVALYIRIALPFDEIFVGDWIKFSGTDAYYHMRIIDNLVANFPHLSSWNPYWIFPQGSAVTGFPFFDYFIAGITWLIGLGTPSQHTIDIVGVYSPAVLGALTVVPVYLIGKAVFNCWAGAIAAGLIALAPGEVLGRSILGFTDHHAVEVLFTTVMLLFLILAIKSSREKDLTYSDLQSRNWKVIHSPLIYSLLAGIFLGIYMLTWRGALLFVFIIFIFFIAQYVIDHVRRRSTDYLCVISSITLIIALVITIPMSLSIIYLASLLIALITPVVLSIISRLMVKVNLTPVYYPLGLLFVGLIGLAILYGIRPSLLGSMLENFSVFAPSEAMRTIIETQPILFPGGQFSFKVAWLNFTTGLFLGLISLGILIYLTVRQGKADKTLLVIWGLIILAATLGQRRFAYYFAVNVAVLTGYVSWLILKFFGLGKTPTETVQQVSVETRKKRKKKRRQKARPNLTRRRAIIALGMAVVFFLALFPNIGKAVETASHAYYAPSDAWVESLSWMKDNTPDPFGDNDFYYQLHEGPSEYPAPTYGVAAWWDYGYWIARIAHRVPWANPGQVGAKTIAQFFLAQDEGAINISAKYIVIDNDTTGGKFYALPAWAESKTEDFMEYYHQPGENYLLIHYYPKYYRSLAVRLYNFDGEQVIPRSTTVLHYEERTTADGEHYKEILDTKSFSGYMEAEAFIAGQNSGNYRIASANPYFSPVPLEKLNHFRLIHNSDSSISVPGAGIVPEVKIFEFAADGFDDTPIAGDWDGDNIDTTGLCHPSNSTSPLDYDSNDKLDFGLHFGGDRDRDIISESNSVKKFLF